MKKRLSGNFILGVLVGLVAMGSLLTGAVVDRLVGFDFLDKLGPKNDSVGRVTTQIVDEESVVTKVVEEVSSKVVTVSISKDQLIANPLFDFFGFNQFFGQQQPQSQHIEQDIGTGFIISSDGLVVTNKHVVADTDAKYRVILNQDEEVGVVNIYRDPVNDLAILKIDKTGLNPVVLGDSDQLKVGQSVIAIGTALGEFRSTVTTGVISGLGRGITAGSPFQGSEKLDGVIQTDAAINPGNSGGPLLNSSGQVIGVNVAVSQSGQNIGFALPINIVKESIENFSATGQFDRPYLGVAYQMISKKAAMLNEVPTGAFVQQVVEGSPAQKAGIKVGDIITEIGGVKLSDESEETGLVTVINSKKIGDTVEVKYWRDDAEGTVKVTLEKREE